MLQISAREVLLLRPAENLFQAHFQKGGGALGQVLQDPFPNLNRSRSSGWRLHLGIEVFRLFGQQPPAFQSRQQLQAVALPGRRLRLGQANIGIEVALPLEGQVASLPEPR